LLAIFVEARSPERDVIRVPLLGRNDRVPVWIFKAVDSAAPAQLVGWVVVAVQPLNRVPALLIDAAVRASLARLIRHERQPELHVKSIVAKVALGRDITRAGLSHKAAVDDIPLAFVARTALVPHGSILAVEQNHGS